MTTTIKIRRDTAANWTSVNPILASGEPGLETDTLRLKYGDGTNAWANLSYQSVANATFATNATNANIANVANLVAVANVSGIGNIAVINLDGNSANALRGNGSFGPVDSVGTMISNGDNSFSIDVDGNVVFEGLAPGEGVDRGLVWDYGANANGVNSMIRQDNNGLTVRAWTELGGGANGYSAPVNIVTNQDANTNTWTFDGQGNLTLPGNMILAAGNIQSATISPAFNVGITGINSGNANVIITIASELFEGPLSGQVTISNVNSPVMANGDWWYQSTDFDQFQLFTDSSLTTPVDGTSWPGYVDGGTAVGVGSYEALTVQGGNVSISSNDQTWTFDTDGHLNTPLDAGAYSTGRIQSANGYPTLLAYGSNGHGGPEINWMNGDDLNDMSNANVIRNTMYLNDDGFYVGMNENNVANIFTGSWLFDSDGNLTLPTNTFAVNYANGTPVTLGSTFGFNYFVDVNANAAGIIKPDSNVAANVTYIDFNPVDNSNVNLDTTMTFFTGKYVNVTLNDVANSAVSATYSVNQVTPLLASYLGYNAVYTKQWGDDPAISKIAIFKDNSTATTLTYPDTNNDTFTVSLSTAVGSVSDQVALIVLWTNDSTQAPTNTQLQEYFEAFVDNVLSPAGGVIGTVRDNFYGNINPLTTIVQSWGTNTPFNFEFYTNSVASFYNNATQTGTSGDGIDFTADVIIRGDGTYEINDFTGGTGYQTGDTITIDGASLGGTTIINDLTLTVAGIVGEAGEVIGFDNLTGTNAGVWPDYGISDGGSDQYDDGNFLQTSLNSKLLYGNGLVQNTNAFGSNEWFVGYAYGQFIMVGDNTGDQISSFGTYGETGADGDGERETGNLSPAEYYRMTVNSLLAYNSSVDFSTESEWNVIFDIAGDRTNGVEFSQTQPRTITTNTGDLRITAADDVFIEPYNTLNLRGGDGSPGLNNTGGTVNISAGVGSDATFANASSQNAGPGGDVNIDAGNAGYNDGNATLGANGGSVYVNAGDTEGNGNGGTVAIRGGDVQAGNGNGGTVSINGGTGSGNGVSGNIFFGSNSHVWTMTNAGTTWFPTLTVDLHNGGNQSAQTLQFGNTGIQSVITGPTPSANVNAERLIIQGQRGNGQFSEGGDVYIWAGDAETDAGDIKIYAGDADNVSTGSGGYVNIDGGYGFDSGGQIEITGGYSVGGSGGYALLRGGQGRTQGGNVGVYAGYGEAGPGGNITIQGGGSANGLSAYGNVTISAGAGSWTFANDGQLTIPGNLVANGASPAPILSGFSSLSAANYIIAGANAVILSSSGNISATGNIEIGSNAVILSSSGNISATGNIEIGSNTILLTSLGNISATGHISAGGNISALNIGNIVNANFDGNSQTWLAGNGVFANIAIPTVGNIASIDLDGNSQTWLAGNGVFANIAIPTVGNIASIDLDGNTANTLTGGGTFVTLPVINANTVVWTTAPGSNVATGNAGQAAYDSGGNLYVCVVANTWAKFTGTTSW